MYFGALEHLKDKDVKKFLVVLAVKKRWEKIQPFSMIMYYGVLEHCELGTTTKNNPRKSRLKFQSMRRNSFTTWFHKKIKHDM